MASDYTPTTVSQGFGAETVINQNFTDIASALNEMLSRVNSAANAMGIDLDMGDNRILNLPAAEFNTDPIRLGESNNLGIQNVVQTVPYVAAISIDVTSVTLGRLSLDGNATVTFTGTPLDGQPILLSIKQDATGSRVVTWESRVRFSTDTGDTTLSTTALKTDYIFMRYNLADDKYDVLALNRGF